MNEQELIWSAVMAWVASKAIEIAKRTSWLPIDTTTEVYNRWTARIVALLTTIGIHAVYDPAAGSLLITGLTFGGILQMAGEYAKQYMMQEISYKKFVRTEN